MYRRTSQYTYGSGLTAALLGTLAARPAAALLTTPSLVLFTAGPAITPGQTVAAYTIATFHGYATAALTLSSVVNIDGNTQAVVSTAVFTATAGGVIPPSPILGYLVTDGAAAFYGGEFFTVSVPIANVGDFLQVDLVIPLDMNIPVTA